MERSELLDVKRPLGKASENFGYGFVPSVDSTPEYEAWFETLLNSNSRVDKRASVRLVCENS